jgi:hypothetical protein
MSAISVGFDWAFVLKLGAAGSEPEAPAACGREAEFRTALERYMAGYERSMARSTTVRQDPAVGL